MHIKTGTKLRGTNFRRYIEIHARWAERKQIASNWEELLPNPLSSLITEDVEINFHIKRGRKQYQFKARALIASDVAQYISVNKPEIYADTVDIVPASPKPKRLLRNSRK